MAPPPYEHYEILLPEVRLKDGVTMEVKWWLCPGRILWHLAFTWTDGDGTVHRATASTDDLNRSIAQFQSKTIEERGGHIISGAK